MATAPELSLCSKCYFKVARHGFGVCATKRHNLLYLYSDRVIKMSILYFGDSGVLIYVIEELIILSDLFFMLLYCLLDVFLYIFQKMVLLLMNVEMNFIVIGMVHHLLPA